MCFPLFTRIFNRARPAFGVKAEELRPNAASGRLILSAVYDIRFCEEIFDGWMTQLDRYAATRLFKPRGQSNDNGGENSATTRFKKPDEQERSLRSYLSRLKEDADQCSRATNTILECHVQFANLMALRMDDVSKSMTKVLNYDDSETTRLDNDIKKASHSLSQHVKSMINDLSSFVSALEEIEVAARKKNRTLEGRILRWLKSLFKVLARIVVTLCPVIINLLAPGLSDSVDSLWMAASTIFGEASGSHKGKESESIERMLLFLKENVPREARQAQIKLEGFDEACAVMGLEARMKAGRRVTFSGPDPVAVAEEWRNVAKKYQLLLKDRPETSRS